MKNISKKTLLFAIVYIAIGFVLIKSVGSTVVDIYKKKAEKKEYTTQLEVLKDKEEELKGTVTKLQDPDYIEKYAREKYLYSKDGEIIIRIPE
ncbi:MAG: septum formation initiator family protein [Bacilli bacterium]|nr:septum formation initiator family protein [Bacilli bacterium]